MTLHPNPLDLKKKCISFQNVCLYLVLNQMERIIARKENGECNYYSTQTLSLLNTLSYLISCKMTVFDIPITDYNYLIA